MRDSTFQRIIGDPDFDPHGIIEDALVEFIKNRPSKVARDRVALKWLVRDPTIIGDIAGVVDINDLEMLEPFLESVAKHDGYQRGGVYCRIVDRLVDVKQENVDVAFAMIVKAWNPRPKTIPEEFIDRLRPEQINDITQTMLDNKSEALWDAGDWKVATRTMFGIETFVSVFASDKMSIDNKTFPIISGAAKATARTPLATRLIDAIDNKWSTYVCFKCGYGANLDSFGHRRSGNKVPKLIKSLSGYALHRKKCDPGNEHPSPHEIITGSPKHLEFQCDYCSEIFTTMSGLTLHRKACS